jgi:hypothetical protein
MAGILQGAAGLGGGGSGGALNGAAGIGGSVAKRGNYYVNKFVQSGTAAKREGLVARIKPIKGITPKRALDTAIWLPAWLNTMTVTETALHNEYDTLSAGHFSMPAMGGPSARQFRTTEADTITVDFGGETWLTVLGQDPVTLRKRMYEILRYKKPVHLLVTFQPDNGQPSELDMYCTFREIDKDVRNGETEARYLTVQISEWRDMSTERRSTKPDGASRKQGASLPTTHVLTGEDTLDSLAMAYYGKYSDWRDIRDANGITKRFGAKTPVVSLSGAWKPGAKIKIPKLGKS